MLAAGTKFAALLKNFAYALRIRAQNNGLLRLGRAHMPVCVGVWGLERCHSHPGQVAVAKVLLGVFGVAVVVVVIAVPTVIFLRGESDIPFQY